MAGKARVHELAKELGVTSKDVLAKLKDLGEFVKSASSTVEAPVARRLRDSFSGPRAEQAGPVRPARAPAAWTRGAVPLRAATARRQQRATAPPSAAPAPRPPASCPGAAPSAPARPAARPSALPGPKPARVRSPAPAPAAARRFGRSAGTGPAPSSRRVRRPSRPRPRPAARSPSGRAGWSGPGGRPAASAVPEARSAFAASRQQPVRCRRRHARAAGPRPAAQPPARPGDPRPPRPAGTAVPATRRAVTVRRPATVATAVPGRTPATCRQGRTRA